MTAYKSESLIKSRLASISQIAGGIEYSMGTLEDMFELIKAGKSINIGDNEAYGYRLTGNTHKFKGQDEYAGTLWVVRSAANGMHEFCEIVQNSTYSAIGLMEIRHHLNVIHDLMTCMDKKSSTLAVRDMDQTLKCLELEAKIKR